MYVDVHAHLTHEKFKNDLLEVIYRAKKNKVIINLRKMEIRS